MLRMALVCHAATDATRQASFPADEPLNDQGQRRARALSLRLATGARCLTSPALRARQTAAAIGLPAEIEPALRDCDYGDWAGKTFDAIRGDNPAGLERWLSDPAAAPHGGESLSCLFRRIADWLEAEGSREEQRSRTLVAVTHASIVKAAIVHVVGAPAQAFWRVDVSPLSVTRLRRSHRAWTLGTVNERLEPSARSDD